MEQKHLFLNEQEDEILVARTLAGEQTAFDILLLRYFASVQRLCFRLLQTTLEAQDVAQEAALQAFLGLARLQEPARFGAWFHAIAANLARSALRKHREFSLQILSDEQSVHVLWQHAPLSLDEIQAAREIHDEILAALQNLSLVNRQAVIGFYLQGYSYAELAQLLGVSVGTVKGRLFQGRQQLKTALQPLAPLQQPSIAQRGKDTTTMTNSPDLIKLEFYSLRTFLLTQQRFAFLRDPLSGRGIPIRLTQSEAEILAHATPLKGYKDIPQFPLDLTGRILESLGTQVVRIVINTLAGQTLYATLTLSQGTQTYNLDVRLSDALALALRTDAPLYATKTLLENELDLNSTSPIPDQPALLEQVKQMQKMKREERLQLEETLHAALAQQKGQVKFLERLWPFLLEASTHTRDGLSVTELRALDPLPTFQPREITLEGQTLTALRIPDEHESAWVLVRPEIWEELVRRLQHLQAPEQAQEVKTKPPVPEPLPTETIQKVEQTLAQLVASTELRTALLLNPHNELIAWQGPDTEETIRSFIGVLSVDMAKHAPLTNEEELNRQLGHQPQMASFMGGNKKDIMQTLPPTIGGIMVTGVTQDWKMVVILAQKPARNLGEETKEQMSKARREFADLLSQV